MTSPGLDPRARPIAAACVRSVRPRHRYAARQLRLLQSEGVPRSATRYPKTARHSGSLPAS